LIPTKSLIDRLQSIETEFPGSFVSKVEGSEIRFIHQSQGVEASYWSPHLGEYITTRANSIPSTNSLREQPEDPHGLRLPG